MIMKKRMVTGLALGVLLSGAWLALAGNEHTPRKDGLLLAAADKAKAPEPAAQEDDFWTTFQRLFSSPEPQYQDRGPQRTEVSGVRGVDQEAKMNEKYNWKAVRQMEQFTVTKQQMFKFLKEGKVGPFFAKKGGGQ
jgi:hypothetical protein